MEHQENTLRKDAYFSGRVVDLEVHTVVLADGTVSTRELVKHKAAVVILALLDRQTVVMVKQFRKSIEQVLLECPAGGIEEGESPLDAAKRELREETGYEAKDWKALGSIVMTPGFCDEILHAFVAKDLTKGALCLDEDERVEVLTYSLSSLKESMLNPHCIIDGKSQALFFRYLAGYA